MKRYDSVMTFTEKEVREMLESARVEMRNHCAEVLRGPLGQALLGDKTTAELAASIIADCLCGGHFPPPLKRRHE